MKENKHKFFATFTYSYEDGELYSYMEHGEIFNRLPYLQISKH